MAALDSAWVQGLLWAVAIVAGVWALVPALVFPFYPRKFENEVIEDLREAEPRGDDSAYEDWFTELAALGFVPVGKMRLSARFFSPLHWRWRSHGTRVLALRDGTISAHLHRVAGTNPLRVSLITTFHEGGVIDTATPGVGVIVNRGNDQRSEIKHADAATLVERHQQEVARLASARSLTVKRATFREMAADCLAYEQRMVPRSKMAGAYLVFAFVAMALWSALNDVELADAQAWWPPVLLCCAVLGFVVCRWAILPGRVPPVIRIAVMLAVLWVPTWMVFGLPDWIKPP